MEKRNTIIDIVHKQINTRHNCFCKGVLFTTEAELNRQTSLPTDKSTQIRHIMKKAVTQSFGNKAY